MKAIMKSFALILLTAVASAVDLEQYMPSVLPEQKTAIGYSVGSYVHSVGQDQPQVAKKGGRFVDLCPNAGKCDFSPDQKQGGEIINLDIDAVK